MEKAETLGCKVKGITPVVRVRRKGVITGNRARDRANVYGRRWHVESFFSSLKQCFGEYVSNVKFENIRKELTFKVMIMHVFR